ncbi:MAG TPA: heavy metal transporter [Microscillaceae bacterium]|nr:heavy metal transporter [Microscillaceae bacterium]
MQAHFINHSRFITLFVALLPLACKPSTQNSKEAIIQTSAICEMCKERLEKDLKTTKGVQKASLNLADKKMTVIFDSTQTNVANIRIAISQIGYDADKVAGVKEAHDKLPDCCQKTNKNAKHNE